MFDLSLTPLLLLPLVGGYAFVKEWNRTRFLVVREEGHKLYFRSVYWGVILFLICYCILGLAEPWVVPNQLAFWWSNEHLVVAALITSSFVGPLAAKILNCFGNSVQFYLEAIKDNEFEVLLVNAVSREFMVMVTMDDGKVYVGWVYKTADPSKGERKYFSIIPVISGHRNQERRVCFTTFYDQIYQGFEDNESQSLTPEDFVVVLPVSRMLSARVFDAVSYGKFSEGRISNRPDEPERKTPA